MTSTEHEILARLVGWTQVYDTNYYGNMWFSPKVGQKPQVDCPDMTTPEAMVELKKMCRERGIGLCLWTRCAGYRCEAFPGGMKTLRGEADTPMEATAQAVLALEAGGYLKEGEPVCEACGGTRDVRAVSGAHCGKMVPCPKCAGKEGGK